MTAQELYEKGQLQAAIDAQIADVKAKPGDQSKRLFLFELLCFAGEWDRAQRQMDAMKFEDVELEAAALGYRKLLDSEAARRKVFKEGQRPKFLGESAEAPVPNHVRLRLEAIAALRQDKQAEATALLAEAEACTPSLTGTLNGAEFDLLCDADSVLSGVLEVMAQGNYFWVPLSSVAAIGINPPKYPRDLLWIPAQLQTHNGETGQVYLPALYPLSGEHADESVRLGRMTDWSDKPDAPVVGKGLKMFLAGADAVTILDWRELVVNPSDEPAPAEPSESE